MVSKIPQPINANGSMQQKIKTIYQTLIVFPLLIITGILAILLRVISFGYLLNFNREYLIKWVSRLILKLIAIRFEPIDKRTFPKEPVFYTFNHNSYFDPFMLTAMGIPNCKIVLSEKTLKILPLTLVAFGIGIIYIPMKKNVARRLRFFKKLEANILKDKFSVFASSEGVHDFIDGIAPFNKGVYHMATVCKLDIIPIYFHIPKTSNPLDNQSIYNLQFESGQAYVAMLDRISVKDWKLSELEENKEMVRNIFVNQFNLAHDINTNRK